MAVKSLPYGSKQDKYESNENTKMEEAARRQLLVSATLHLITHFLFDRVIYPVGYNIYYNR